MQALPLRSGHLAKLADLAFAFTHSGKEPPTPLDGLGLRPDLHHRVSAEEPASIWERSITHGELSRIDPNSRSRRARLEAFAPEEHAGLSHFHHQLPYSFHLFGAGSIRFRFSRFVQQHESHCDRSLSR